MHTILIGDAREQLATLPDASVQTCVTSPPYFGLRSYLDADEDGKAHEIGTEPTVEAYVANLVAVFREVRRVPHDTGTVWCNLGDSYARPAEKGGSGTPNGRNVADMGYTGEKPIPTGLKPKDLIGIPWRVAFALQADGWYLRSEIIWHKPNPMPESVTDRPTKAHEQVFLLSKSPRYYYDAAAIAEPGGEPKPCGPKNDASQNDSDRTGIVRGNGVTRNKRSVWTISTTPYSGAHFATFPPKLIEPCILAGTSEKGQCRACGAPWVRVVERANGYDGAGRSTDTYTAKAYEHPQSAPRGPKSNFGPGRNGETTGWAPSCECDAGDPIPQTVLDPFCGSGTTIMVAERHARHAIGIDLDPDNRALIAERTAQRPLWDALTTAD